MDGQPNSCFADCLADELGIDFEIVDCDDGNNIQQLPLDQKVKIASEDLGGLNLTPNPVGNQATVTVDFKKAIGNATITVMTLNGEVKLVETQQLNEGSNAVNLNTSSLSPGIYFLRVQTESGLKTTRFVK